MSTEKRAYERETVNLEALFYVSNGDRTVDVVGIVKDISARGIGVEIKAGSAIDGLIGVGSVISFQCVDEFELFGKPETQILNMKVTAVWKRESDEVLCLGGELDKPSMVIERYLDKKRVCKYMKGI